MPIYTRRAFLEATVGGGLVVPAVTVGKAAGWMDRPEGGCTARC